MIVISSAELHRNMQKYFDIAREEQVLIQRGETEPFVLQKEEYLQPDEDLARAITAEELLERGIPRVEKMIEE